jgi:protein NrfD
VKEDLDMDSTVVRERTNSGPPDSYVGFAWGLAIAATIAGVVGVVWRFTGGHAAANYGSYVPWGLWIAAYVTLVGGSAGAFAFAALVFTQRKIEHYRMAVLGILVALGAFAAGMINVWLDLGHPLRVWKLMLETSFSSIMGLMAWLYVAYGVILAVGLWMALRGSVPRFMERFGWVAFLFAVMFAGAEGALFGVVGARPLWESGLTPVLFLVEAGLLGLGMVVAAGALFQFLDSGFAHRLGTILLSLLGVRLVLEWAEYSTGLLAAVPAKADAIKTILFGPYWWVFWIVHLVVGLVIPAAILLARRGDVVATGVAGFLIAITGISAKLNLILSALTQESIEGLADAFTGPGLETSYFPSLMEWLVWIGTLGMAGLIVLVGRRFLSPFFDADRLAATTRQETR